MRGHYEIGRTSVLNIGRIDTTDIVRILQSSSENFAVLKFSRSGVSWSTLASTHGSFMSTTCGSTAASFVFGDTDSDRQSLMS